MHTCTHAHFTEYIAWSQKHVPTYVQVYAFYMRLWKIFYGAYFCLPFTR